MRLLDTSTIKLKSHFEPNIPSYAILSHTWGSEEYLFEDVQKGQGQSKEGYKKVLGACALAKGQGRRYIWIDTCCIDKSSSSELSEAINSMFRWYELSAVCIVYLVDVEAVEPFHTSDAGELPDSICETFVRSRYFQRGWTLQELIAPTTVELYTSDWRFIAHRHTLANVLFDITRVDTGILQRQEPLFATSVRERLKYSTPIWRELRNKSVARRMSWASGRVTSRPEDLAYCLMGMMGVNMPLLYGEGQRNAFYRLQEHVLRQYDDQSILAWELPSKGHYYDEHNVLGGWMAPHPDAFRNTGDIVPLRQSADYSVSEKGLQLTVGTITDPSYDRYLLALLNCHREHDLHEVVALPLVKELPRSQSRKGLGGSIQAQRRSARHIQTVIAEPEQFEYLSIPRDPHSIREVPDGKYLSFDYVVLKKTTPEVRFDLIKPWLTNRGRADETYDLLDLKSARDLGGATFPIEIPRHNEPSHIVIISFSWGPYSPSVVLRTTLSEDDEHGPRDEKFQALSAWQESSNQERAFPSAWDEMLLPAEQVADLEDPAPSLARSVADPLSSIHQSSQQKTVRVLTAEARKATMLCYNVFEVIVSVKEWPESEVSLHKEFGAHVKSNRERWSRLFEEHRLKNTESAVSRPLPTRDSSVLD